MQRTIRIPKPADPLRGMIAAPIRKWRTSEAPAVSVRTLTPTQRVIANLRKLADRMEGKL